FKNLFDEDKGNSHASDKIKNYFSNHGEKPDIIDRVLSDLLWESGYNWELSNHKYWERVKIKISSSL
ncbi:MAG: hypothetical protein ABIP51_04355, partial [Bacteroidia bacterium]